MDPDRIAELQAGGHSVLAHKYNDLAECPVCSEPSVMGAGAGPSPIPLRSEAEAVWRRLYVDRMVERGIDREDAQACCDAGDVDLSENPADAADDELQYWTDDEGPEDSKR